MAFLLNNSSLRNVQSTTVKKTSIMARGVLVEVSKSSEADWRGFSFELYWLDLASDCCRYYIADSVPSEFEGEKWVTDVLVHFKCPTLTICSFDSVTLHFANSHFQVCHWFLFTNQTLTIAPDLQVNFQQRSVKSVCCCRCQCLQVPCAHPDTTLTDNCQSSRLFIGTLDLFHLV